MEMQEELKQKEGELRQEREKLAETNTALRVLLRQRDEDRLRLEETVYNNVDRWCCPTSKNSCRANFQTSIEPLPKLPTITFGTLSHRFWDPLFGWGSC